MMNLTTMQRQFTAPLRDQNLPPFKGIDKRRYRIYQDLLMNNVASLLSQNLPIVSARLGEKQWRQLVKRFYQQHACHSPYFHELGQEFIDFLNSLPDQDAVLSHHPYLLDLVTYEYLELVLELAEDIGTEFVLSIDELNEHQNFTANPLASLQISRYPLHQINLKDPVIAQAVPTCLLVYRNAQDEVKFAQLSILSAQVWQVLMQSPKLTLQDCINHPSWIALAIDKPALIKVLQTFVNMGLLIRV